MSGALDLHDAVAGGVLVVVVAAELAAELPVVAVDAASRPGEGVMVHTPVMREDLLSLTGREMKGSKKRTGMDQ